MRALQTIIIGLISLVHLFAACDKIRSVAIVDTTQTSATINWKDNNTSIVGYQMAHALRGLPIKDAYKSGVFVQKSATISDLTSGTSYSFWIRTICATNDTSKWEGPFLLTTILSNPSRCKMGLDITDNGCNSPKGGDEFAIDISGLDIGQNIILESVSIIVSHTWPADLTIRLENPVGKSILLSKENGTLKDDYGIVSDDCIRPCIFANAACQSIKDGLPPFEGYFLPEESLNDLFLLNPNGRWKIKICDGAINDRGKLQYVALNFSSVQCFAPIDYYVSQVSDRTVEVAWSNSENCEQMEVHYKECDNPNFDLTDVVICANGKLLIANLKPNTCYDYYLISDCTNAKSSPTCIKKVTTLCAPSNVLENFDQLSECDPICNVACNVQGLFYNVNDASINWTVNSKNTPTDFTGPDEGALGGGKYVYVESNPNLCGGFKLAALESNCLQSSIGSNCDLSFFYHMYGKDIGQLRLKKSLDNRKTWEEVFTVSGNQGNEWKHAQIPLQLSSNTKYTLRIEATTNDGVEGDIALDQVSISGSTLKPQSVFYKDKDGDQFGISADSIVSCTTTPPVGYALKKGDCDDNNNAINPSAADIPCNAIDENCDGKLELTNILNPVKIVSSIIEQETCKGKNDGKIKINVSGGSPPYVFEWNGVEGLDSLTNIGQGIYSVKVTDVNGCGLVLSNLEVKTISNYNIVVDAIKKPTCKGVHNGSISIKHNGAYPPFTFIWTNGAIDQNLTAIPDGNYQLRMTDALGCVAESNVITLTALSTLNAVNSYAKHPLCFGDSTGILEFDVVGGVPPIKYFWEDGFIGKRREKLAEGIYRLTISDGESCTTILDGKVDAPDKINIQVANLEEVRCHGSKSGQIKLIIDGGVEPYDYIWSDGYTLQNRNNLGAGVYGITISDNNGCKQQLKNIAIRQSDSIYYHIDSIKHASCLMKNDGGIYTSIFGGVSPYTFYWSQGNSQNSNNLQLLPFNYTLTIVDKNNCKLTTDAITIQNKNLSFPVDIKILQSLTCPGVNDAKIIAQSNNAILPLDFNWSAGVQHVGNTYSDTLIQIGSGSYMVTITDAQSCVSTSDVVFITSVSPFNLKISTSDNQCNTDSIGMISVIASGGNPPYLYLWSNGALNDTITALPNGIYVLELVDKKACRFKSQPIGIFSTSDISMNIENIGAESGKKNGSIRINPFGGQGVYSIDWSDNTLNGFFVENLDVGKYFFTITDQLGCSIDSCSIIDNRSNSQESYFKNLSIMPNPASEWVAIKGLQEMDEVTIFNISGQSMEVNRIYESDHIIKINIGNWIPGMYLIRISHENHIGYRLFIKI